MVGEAQKRGDVLEIGYAHAGDATYLAANDAIIREAATLAQNHGDTDPCAIIVWNGTSRGSSDVVQDFANRARADGFKIEEVLTL